MEPTPDLSLTEGQNSTNSNSTVTQTIWTTDEIPGVTDQRHCCGECRLFCNDPLLKILALHISPANVVNSIHEKWEKEVESRSSSTKKQIQEWTKTQARLKVRRVQKKAVLPEVESTPSWNRDRFFDCLKFMILVLSVCVVNVCPLQGQPCNERIFALVCYHILPVVVAAFILFSHVEKHGFKLF